MLDSISDVTFLLLWWFPEPLFLELHLTHLIWVDVCVFVHASVYMLQFVFLCVSVRECQVITSSTVLQGKKCWFWFRLERKKRLIKWRAFWEIHPGWNMSFMFTDCFCSFMFCNSCPLTSLSYSKHVLPFSLRIVHGNLASKDSLCMCVCVQWTHCDLVDLRCSRFLYVRCVNGPPKPVNIHLTHLVFIKTHSLAGCVTLSSCLQWFYLFSLNLVLFLLSSLHHFLDFFNDTSVPHLLFPLPLILLSVGPDDSPRIFHWIF